MYIRYNCDRYITTDIFNVFHFQDDRQDDWQFWSNSFATSVDGDRKRKWNCRICIDEVIISRLLFTVGNTVNKWEGSAYRWSRKNLARLSK